MLGSLQMGTDLKRYSRDLLCTSIPKLLDFESIVKLFSKVQSISLEILVKTNKSYGRIIIVTIIYSVVIPSKVAQGYTYT